MFAILGRTPDPEELEATPDEAVAAPGPVEVTTPNPVEVGTPDPVEVAGVGLPLVTGVLLVTGLTGDPDASSSMSLIIKLTVSVIHFIELVVVDRTTLID